jgi:hypothetical protein
MKTLLIILLIIAIISIALNVLLIYRDKSKNKSIDDVKNISKELSSVINNQFDILKKEMDIVKTDVSAISVAVSVAKKDLSKEAETDNNINESQLTNAGFTKV